MQLPFVTASRGASRGMRGGGGGQARNPETPEKSISAEHLMEFEPPRFEGPARLQSGRWGGGVMTMSDGLGTTAALFPLEAKRCSLVSVCDCVIVAQLEMKRRA